MFEAFLKLRASSAWEGRTSDARRWILAAGPQPIAAVA